MGQSKISAALKNVSAGKSVVAFDEEPQLDLTTIAVTDTIKLLDSLGAMDKRARLLLSRNARLLVACSGMAEIFDAGSCLQLKNGSISTAQPEFGARFSKLLLVGTSDVMTLALPCRLTDGHLLIRATAVCDDVVCLSLQKATEMIQPELPDLMDVFHLTETEAGIVNDLFMGRAPQQIAEDHDNSIHTIRAHIRRCYDKLGISSREQLWHKLNAYRLS